MVRGGRHRIEVAAVFAVLVSSSPALAVISQQFFLSETNKLYYVVAANPSSGSFAAQITSIMMTSGTAVPVNETSNNPPDPVVTSFGTFLTGGILRFPPLSELKRTAIITGLPSNFIEDMGNPLNGDFDPSGDGLLTLPGGARTVRFDGSGTEPVGDITTATGAGVTLVPAATTTSITRRIGMTTFAKLTTIVFPNPPGPVVTSNGATCVGGGNPGAPCDPFNGNSDCSGGGTCTNFGGEAAGQNVTLDDTLGSRVGNPPSQGATIDGFFIPNSTAVIVFMVDGVGAALGLSATGFDVTGTCSNVGETCDADGDCPGGTCTTGLAQRNVLNTTGDVDNANIPPPPTSSASNTPTITPTNTNSPTTTLTPSNTPTPTQPIPTPTSSASNTPTITPTTTRTPSNTPTPTQPIPTLTLTPTVTFSTPSMITISGTCRQPGATGLEPCAAGTRVVASRCIDRSCASLEQLAETTTDANGEYHLTFDATPAGDRRIIAATIVDGGGTGAARAAAFGTASDTTFRIIDLGSAAVMRSGVDVDPASEAGVELLEQGGLENYTDSRIEGVLTTVRISNASTDFAGLSPDEAVEEAKTVARGAPPVQARLACSGDCNLGGDTSINELITAVNITLGTRPVVTCEAVDSDADGQVGINELIEAVNVALNGCAITAPGAEVS